MWTRTVNWSRLVHNKQNKYDSTTFCFFWICCCSNSASVQIHHKHVSIDCTKCQQAFQPYGTWFWNCMLDNYTANRIALILDIAHRRNKSNKTKRNLFICFAYTTFGVCEWRFKNQLQYANWYSKHNPCVREWLPSARVKERRVRAAQIWSRFSFGWNDLV